ncbi:MAG TPA: hypothetical protein VIX73_26010, partial [Kofleriaceae bacterium]
MSQIINADTTDAAPHESKLPWEKLGNDFSSPGARWIARAAGAPVASRAIGACTGDKPGLFSACSTT